MRDRASVDDRIALDRDIDPVGAENRFTGNPPYQLGIPYRCPCKPIDRRWSTERIVESAAENDGSDHRDHDADAFPDHSEKEKSERATEENHELAGRWLGKPGQSDTGGERERKLQSGVEFPVPIEHGGDGMIWSDEVMIVRSESLLSTQNRIFSAR
jgi:hypothetical protein